MNVQEGLKLKQKLLIPLVGECYYNKIGNEVVIDKIEGTMVRVKSTTHGFGFVSSIQEIEAYFEEVVEEPAAPETIVTEAEATFTAKAKVIINGRATIVILEDGSKGVAKCNPEDVYDEAKGKDIALLRAMIKNLTRDLKRITK